MIPIMGIYMYSNGIKLQKIMLMENVTVYEITFNGICLARILI